MQKQLLQDLDGYDSFQVSFRSWAGIVGDDLGAMLDGVPKRRRYIRFDFGCQIGSCSGFWKTDEV
jgi:hypothetical protein